MMRVAAAAVMFLCSIATVSAQEPTGTPSDQPEQKICVFAGENYSEGAEFCVAGHAGLKCESGKWSRDTQLDCGGEVSEQHTKPYHGTDDHDHMDHMDHMNQQ
jgi:hypothetical protein